MYKNQLQELAQRSCFNLPSYACVREGPDHAPRFKASVNFNGEIFQGPSNCTTLRQAEHAAAEDETGVYKNLLQETAHRAGLKLPVYTTVRSGPGHQPVFTSTVELANICLVGEPAKTKKQAEKNAAMAAWSALRKIPDLEPSSWVKDIGSGVGQEHEQVVRVLCNFKSTEETNQHLLPQKQRGKALLGCNEGTSSLSFPRFQQQWRSLEPAVDLPVTSTCQQKHKRSSLQPPILSPATRVASKSQFSPNSGVSSRELFSPKDKFSSPSYLPTYRPISALNNSSLARSQETQIEGRNRELVHETAMLQGKTSSFVVPAYSKHFPSQPFSSSPPLKIHTAADSVRNSPSLLARRTMITGIAPAVQIRSVIPVCATPPLRPSLQPPTPPIADDRSAVAPAKDTELLAANSKLSNLRL
ncbi:hypothetical protein HPP92_022997 [Vanilla planifolia]|uniref:DRBM domain-containing protein n=1 Tax=Vanilla planifolia TaxID=51239 RepID=A0A835UE57_VANPL|nr:hypothetical protein HPP92_022997 [Vanilla planifolia]